MKKIINLGCGTRTSSLCVNIDWSVYTMMKNNHLLRFVLTPFLTGERKKNLESIIKDKVVHYDLRKGLPYKNNTIDAVYHSHFFEHLDKEAAVLFCEEVYRVLKPKGIHRIVVPDLEVYARMYLEALDTGEIRKEHDDYVFNIIGQCVQREATGTSQQKWLRRRIENMVLGDARKRGHTHQWMYDKINLTYLLKYTGYSESHITSYDKSKISDEWLSFGLDNEGLEPYKEHSLYVEAVK